MIVKKGKIGDGMHGVVYKGILDNKVCAIKRNIKEIDTDFINSIREADILVKISGYPYVCPLTDIAFGEPFKNADFSPIAESNKRTNDEIHFVFDIATENLSKVISRRNYRCYKDYMVQLLLALDYLHKNNIIHQDLKPDNILVYDSEVAKICDFGLSKYTTKQLENTPRCYSVLFRPPEIFKELNYDCRADIWALGCIFFEMISNEPFIDVPNDNNDTIMMYIIRRVPYIIDKKTLTRYKIKQRKFFSENLKSKKSFKELINMSQLDAKEFEKYLGKIDAFCDLLEKMLSFDNEARWTAERCLDHPFFSSHQDLINEGRQQFYKVHNPPPIKIIKCKEREWVFDIIHIIHTRRNEFEWYTDRTLIHSIHIFDRFLNFLFENAKIPENKVETKLSGRLLSKSNSVLLYTTCLYMTIKFFYCAYAPPKYEEVFDKQYHNKQSKKKVKKWEERFLTDCNFEFYYPCIYEYADKKDKIWTRDEIKKIIGFYETGEIDGINSKKFYDLLTA